MNAPPKELVQSVMGSPIATVLTDPRLADNPIVVVNDAFCALTLYSPEEIIGRNCRFLAGPATEPWLTEQIKQAVARKSATVTEILNYRKDGSTFRNAVLVAPIFDDDGELAYFLGSQVELDGQSPVPESRRRAEAVSTIKRLSPRQMQILREMAAGYRNKQIAWRLSISEKTVKMHRALMMTKLQVATSSDAVRLAVEAGL